MIWRGHLPAGFRTPVFRPPLQSRCEGRDGRFPRTAAALCARRSRRSHRPDGGGLDSGAASSTISRTRTQNQVAGPVLLESSTAHARAVVLDLLQALEHALHTLEGGCAGRSVESNLRSAHVSAESPRTCCAGRCGSWPSGWRSSRRDGRVRPFVHDDGDATNRSGSAAAHDVHDRPSQAGASLWPASRSMGLDRRSLGWT